jgi:PTS system cellobiose-specific IIC component
MLSILVSFMVVYQTMGALKHRTYQVVGGLTGICAYILAMKGTINAKGVFAVDWNRFGPTGIVVALLIAVYVSIIFNLIAKLHLFENNDTIPEFVQEWIKNIIPIFLAILILKIVINDLDVDLFPIVTAIFNPIQAIAQTYWGFLLMAMIPAFFFSMGISGWTWSGPQNAIYIPAMAANVAAVAHGGVARNLTTSEVLSGISLVILGGIGCTLALNIYFLFSKSKRLRTLGRVCIGPSIFNINEPILFGTPIVFNPILMLPMWICTFVGATITWFILKLGWLNVPHIQMTLVGTIPGPVSTVMFTQDMRGVLWWVILLLIYLGIWYPFFKVYERQTIAEENKEAERQAAKKANKGVSSVLESDVATNA